MREAFALQKLLTFFQQKILSQLRFNIGKFNISLTNDVVSFEQPDPKFYKRKVKYSPAHNGRMGIFSVSNVHFKRIYLLVESNQIDLLVLNPESGLSPSTFNIYKLTHQMYKLESVQA